jgi:hypothetical protein
MGRVRRNVAMDYQSVSDLDDQADDWTLFSDADSLFSESNASTESFDSYQSWSYENAPALLVSLPVDLPCH